MNKFKLTYVCENNFQNNYYIIKGKISTDLRTPFKSMYMILWILLYLIVACKKFQYVVIKKKVCITLTNWLFYKTWDMIIYL